MHYSSPGFTLTFNALHFSAFLLVPARHSFACCIFPPFRRIYSVVRQWKKHLSSVTKVLPRLLSAAYRPSRLCTLRDPLRRLYLAPRCFTRRTHSRTHTHAHATEEPGNCDFVTHDEQRWHRSFIREKLYSFASSSTLRDLWYNTRDTLMRLSQKQSL